MKKDEIKVSLTQGLFETLSRHAKSHSMSFQQYASTLAFQVTNNDDVIRSIAAWFRRGYALRPDHWCMGRVIAPKYQDLLPDGKMSIRRSLKLQPEEYLRICEVASALACPPATAVTILLFSSQLLGVDIVVGTEDTEDTKTLRIG